MTRLKDMTIEELLEEIGNYRQAFIDEYNAKHEILAMLNEAESKLEIFKKNGYDIISNKVVKTKP